MKTIEEKAQAYEKAIERAKITLDCCDSASTVTKNTVYGIFPELRESEDEKIKEEIINYFQCQSRDEPSRKTTHKKWIAWLEKQGKKEINDKDTIQSYSFYSYKGEPKFKVGDIIKHKKLGLIFEIIAIDTEYRVSGCNGTHLPFDFQDFYELVEQKPADKVEPKFREGDWITNGEYTWKIISVGNLDYTLQNQLGECVEDTIDYADTNFHLWTIQDAKDGDVLCSGQLIVLFKQWEDNTDYTFVIAHAGIDISGKLQITNGHWLISNESKPATKKQHDLLFQKMKEAGYEWNTEKKELMKIEQP